MTSVESLLSEASPLLESYLTLKTADQLFFGDSTVYGDYSNLGPSSSRGATGEAHGKGHSGKEHKKGKKEKNVKDVLANKHDSMEVVISDTKRIIHSALHDEAGDRSTFSIDVTRLEKEVKTLKHEMSQMRETVDALGDLVKHLSEQFNSISLTKPAEVISAKTEEEKNADDFDLFESSDEEVDEEKERIKQERLKAYAEKKAKKPASIAKSSVILDVKPWDDETDMIEMEKKVREIEWDGLVWGGSKLIPLAYGLKKLQIICIIEDEKVSVDDLTDKIVNEISDHVQSVDIAAFNKI